MVYSLENPQPIDYLLVGHLTCDLVNGSSRLGGSVAYAALTAKALGMRVGIITSYAEDLPIDQLASIPIINLVSLTTTTFSNQETPQGRIQKIYHRAETLEYYLVPQAWRNSAILHLAPVAQEVSADFVRHFPHSFIGITPQGWLRAWDKEGNVHPTEWPEATFVLPYVNATVISIEDVGRNEERIEEISASCHILAVTEGAEGSRVYWNGDVRRFRPPANLTEVDPVGAGDIYAAAFFIRLFETRDPWEAGRFATQLASYSITRAGLDSPPTRQEIEACRIEVY
ncbi:MAG: hypothetical protein DDG59_05885 [Anaerolineae bacterium]|jgi:sugar/nucleoside kinase (ribokinase family)|nr:MAG: hypothetical protein DDG59_05885 [Anaerolineae bacterium]